MRAVPHRAVPAVVAGVVGVCVLLAGLRFVDYFASLHAEKAENEALHDALDQACAQLARLEADLVDMRDVEQRMRLLAGLDELDEPETLLEDEVGAADAYDAIEGDRVRILRTSLERATHRASHLKGDMTQVEGALTHVREGLEGVPSILPTDGWLSAAFGRRRDPFTGRRSFHWGVDVAGREGTEVLATAAGKVVFSGRNGGYGYQIKIDHGNGYLTTYAHNKKNLVKRGQEVERGQAIALLGSTGRSTSSHVHYEVHRDGKKVNPWRYLLPEDAVVD